jgi:hypothetical protein
VEAPGHNLEQLSADGTRIVDGTLTKDTSLRHIALWDKETNDPAKGSRKIEDNCSCLQLQKSA